MSEMVQQITCSRGELGSGLRTISREEVGRNIVKKVGRFGKSGGLSEGGSFAKSREKSGDGR